METNKIVKWIAYGIEAALVITIIALSIAVSVKNKQIKSLKEQINKEWAMTDSLQDRCTRLGQMEGISVSTTFVINNKNILSLSSNAVSNVTRNYAVMTKDEVLNALDSLNNRRNNKE